jgi:hypothetical protein
VIEVGQIWQATPDFGQTLNWNDHVIYMVTVTSRSTTSLSGNNWTGKRLCGMNRGDSYLFPNSTETARNWRLGSVCSSCQKFYPMPETKNFKCWRCEVET